MLCIFCYSLYLFLYHDFKKLAVRNYVKVEKDGANWIFKINLVKGSRKFLDRVYRLITSKEILAENNGALDKVYNETVKSVTEQIESMKFNTAIAQLMVFVNAANKEDKLYVDYAKGFIQLIAPFAPHLAEELWQTVTATDDSISYVTWLTWD
ncbi:leucyl-tRNA synthetase [Streptococcus oralis subsp. oralis]|uniref:leucine--tRNA ligase n=1 Tax=Streptococcus oralis subsp. oralis TaxID=1891914 RepID=A0A0F2CVP1_STROR|nr:leucyl-tRNA synthetase [Streptococcus oralis subsp. oralis]